MSDETLTDFLLARIAEDEAEATAYLADLNDNPPSVHNMVQVGWIDAGSPARVLAECEAKRRIVALHASSSRDPFYTHKGHLVDTCDACVSFHADMDCSNEPWPCPTLRILALPYADHPECQEAWKP